MPQPRALGESPLPTHDGGMDTRPAYMKLVDRGPPLQEVKQCMDDGDHWVLAWNRQSDVIYRHLGRDSRIEDRRIGEIEAGDVPTRAELEKLAKVWRVSVEAIEATLPFSILH